MATKTRRKSVAVTMQMLRRARVLKEAGLSYPGIVIVLGVDLGVTLDEIPSPDTFRHYLGPGGKKVGVAHCNPTSFTNFGNRDE